MNYSFKKTFVFSVLLLSVTFIFLLMSECYAQKFFNRRPAFRQQQIENRVHQITPQNAPAVEEKAPTPAPAVEKKSEETPAVEKKSEETPAVEKKSEETPAVEEKSEETPVVDEKSEETQVVDEKSEETPTVDEKSEEPPVVDEKSEEPPVVEEISEEFSVLEEENVEDSPSVKKEDFKLEDEFSVDSVELPEESLQKEAVEKVLADPNIPEEAKPALKQATKEEIQKSVEEATAEVEADNKNEHIDGVVEGSLKEVDEESIESAVQEVLDSTAETLKEDLKRNGTLQEEADEALPGSVNQVIEEAEAVSKADEKKADEVSAVEEKTDEAETKVETSEQTTAKMVKLEDLDKELKIPENATYDELQAFLTGLDAIRPADLDQTNQDVMMEQVKTFFLKLFQAKLDASNQMLALESLTDEQWKEAVSWKVQSLANLFRIDETKVAEMRKFVEEISPKAPKDVLWTVESILIEMELAQVKEEPKPEELKAHVARMLEHTKKGIDEKCVSLDFVLATVQMVALTEDALPKEESKAIFESAIEILNASEMNQLKETAKFLRKILDQREIVGKTPDLTIETYDGKTIKTADFVGKTLLIYCFQISSREQLQDLGLVYQIYMAYHARGLEVIGIVPEEKTDEMKELLDQIPWPMVFDGKDVIEKLSVPTLPAKICVNTEGKIESTNMGPLDLMKHLEAAYGPAVKNSDEEPVEKLETTEEAEESTEETKSIDPPSEAWELELKDSDKNSDVKDEEKTVEKVEKKVGELDLNLDL